MAQAALNVALRTLLEVAGRDFGLPTIEHQAVPFGSLLKLARLLVGPFFRGGQRNTAHLPPIRERAQLWVFTHMAD